MSVGGSVTYSNFRSPAFLFCIVRCWAAFIFGAHCRRLATNVCWVSRLSAPRHVSLSSRSCFLLGLSIRCLPISPSPSPFLLLLASVELALRLFRVSAGPVAILAANLGGPFLSVGTTRLSFLSKKVPVFHFIFVWFIRRVASQLLAEILVRNVSSASVYPF